MRKTSLLTLTSLILIAGSMLLIGTTPAQFQSGTKTWFKLTLPNGSQFMNVTAPTPYDVGDKFNVTVSIYNVTEISAFGFTLLWNATFCNATGNYWYSDTIMDLVAQGKWDKLPPMYITNDYDHEKLGDVLQIPLIGVAAGFTCKALGAANSITVPGDLEMLTMEFQINTYGPSWFYVWKDPSHYSPWPYTGAVGLFYESMFPEGTHPTPSMWQSPLGPPPYYTMDYDVLWYDGQPTPTSAFMFPASALLIANPPPPVIESCDSTGVNKDLFDLSETVHVNGSGYSPSTTYDIYIVNDETSWSDGMTIPTRVPGTNTTVSSNPTGDIPPTAVWSPDLTLGKYDIVVDVNNNSKYDVGIDALDDMDIEETAGFHVIPEFPSLIILPLFMIATLLAVIVYGRKHSMRARIDVK